MKDKESRRIVPISAVTLITLAAMFVLELLVIGGAFEVQASTIARVAPWAYEPFLLLVGEHPDSETQRRYLEKKKAADADEAKTDPVTGLKVGLPLNPTNEGNSLLLPADSKGTDPAGAETVLPSEAAPEEAEAKVVPVG